MSVPHILGYLPLALVTRSLDLASEEIPPERVETLQRLEPAIAAVDSLRVHVLVAFGVVALAVLLPSLWKTLSTNARPPSAPWRFAILTVLAVPGGSVLGMALSPEPVTAGAAIAGLSLGTAVLLSAALLSARRWGSEAALRTVLLGTTAVLLVDQWLGGPWSYVGFFGYSPMDGIRFYGMGNEAAAILFATSLMGFGTASDGSSRPSSEQVTSRMALAVLAAAVVFTAAAPSLGANFTVALWALVGFAVTWSRLSPHVSRRRVAMVAAITLLLTVSALLALDLIGQRTHFARFTAALNADGPVAAVDLAASKAAIFVDVFWTTPGSIPLLLLAVAFGLALRRPRGLFAEILSRDRYFDAALRGLFVGTLVATFTEDSGIAMLALSAVFVAAAVAYRGSLIRSKEAEVGPSGKVACGGASET